MKVLNFPFDLIYCRSFQNPILLATMGSLSYLHSLSSIGFLLELQKDGGKMADAATLLSISDYIHLVLIKTDPSGDTTLIGSHFLPWRDILSAANGRLTSAVEINGVGAEAKVPMGIVEIKFEIIPRLSQVRLYLYVHEQMFSFLLIVYHQQVKT